MQPEISIIIPSYKAEAWIARALESIVEQRKSLNIETIVVEDGCFDATKSVVDKFKDIRLITLDGNYGASAARNYGLNAAKSNYVLFLDADDYIQGSLLDGLISALKRSSADVAFGPMRLMGANYSATNIFYPERCDSLSWIAARLEGRRWAKPWPGRVAWRKSVLLSNGGWNESLEGGQDEELVMRCLLNGAEPTVSHEGVGIYWQHDSPARITNSRNNEISAQVTYKQIKEWIDSGAGQGGALRIPLAKFCYRVAKRSYWDGLIAEGEAWLSRARALGLPGHPGSLRHKVLSNVLGLRRKQKVAFLFNRIRNS